jgi:hypothetical protein
MSSLAEGGGLTLIPVNCGVPPAIVTWIKARTFAWHYRDLMREPVSSAPYGRDLELAVIERDIPHALAFPCRRVVEGWINAETMRPVDVRPTHWRPWVRLSDTRA